MQLELQRQSPISHTLTHEAGEYQGSPAEQNTENERSLPLSCTQFWLNIAKESLNIVSRSQSVREPKEVHQGVPRTSSPKTVYRCETGLRQNQLHQHWNEWMVAFAPLSIRRSNMAMDNGLAVTAAVVS